MNAILWLGAHKTGTTNLQARLQAMQPILKRHGIGYDPLESFRETHTRPLLDRDAPLPRFSPPSARTQLIFDENILGLVQNVCCPEGLYPEGAWRADEMADRLGLKDPHLVLGLRGFAEYLPSLYCETLKSIPFKPFRSFLRCPMEQLSWQPLVAGLLRVFPNSAMTLYTAEWLRGHETQLLTHLLSLPASEIATGPNEERPGFSQQAIEAMEAGMEDGPIGPAEAKRLAAAHPRGPDRPGFDPWSAQEHADLAARWQSDMTKLRTWSRVKFVDSVAQVVPSRSHA